MYHVGGNRLTHSTESTTDHVKGNVSSFVGWIDKDSVTSCTGVVRKSFYVVLEFVLYGGEYGTAGFFDSP